MNSEFPNKLISYKLQASQKGFTLLELLLVMGIIAIMAAISVPYLGGLLNTVNLDDVATQIVYDVRNAQANATNGVDNSNWAVCFDNPSTNNGVYAISAEGSSSCPLEEDSLRTFLPNGVNFYSPRTGDSTSVVFNKISGTITSAIDIVIYLRSREEQRTVTITPSGVAYSSVPTLLPSFGPSVVTLPASSITNVSAVLEGIANPNNSAATGWFRYDTSDPGACDDIFGTPTSPVSLGSGTSDVVYSRDIVSLTPDTTYYFCAIASNAIDTDSGEVLSFTTVDIPAVANSPATSVTATTAILNSTVDPNGSSTTAWFRYSATDPVTCNNMFGTDTPAVSIGSGNSPVPHSQSISGLTGLTIYYFCAIASNSAGVSYPSTPSSFTTPNIPSVTTEAANPIAGNTATLRGSFSSNGATTTVWFRYTTDFTHTVCADTDTFGTRAPSGTSGGPGVVNSGFTQNISGLSSSTTYYFCAIASNSEGMAFGSILSFTTAAVTNIANGVNPSNIVLAPGAGITDLDSFTLSTSAGTDSVTALTVTLSGGSQAGLSEVRITNDAGTTTYFTAVTNPASATVSFSAGTPIPVTTSAAQFKIRITPKTHANMPVPPGATYSVTGTVTSFTSANSQSGSDNSSATVTIDNLSPSDVVGVSGVEGNTQVSLSWTNPGDADFSNLVILRKTSAITDTPTEGSSPAVSSTIGSSTVIYTSNGASFVDTGLTVGTSYYYKMFVRDTNGNYSAGISAGPYVPVSILYWVGGSGNWNDTTHWSTSSGGAGGAGVPGAPTNVFFNANSFTASGQTVTINVSANVKDMNWTGVTNTPTFAGSSSLNIGGSLTLSAGMTRTYSGAITFSATTTGKTITLAGKTLGSSIAFNGVGGGWTLQDNFSNNSGLDLIEGTLDTNSKAVSITGFNTAGSTSNTRTLILGASTVTVSGTTWGFSGSNSTVNAGTSTIMFTNSSISFTGGGKTYNNVIFSGAGNHIVSNGSNTFNNLTFNGSAVKTDSIQIYNNQTITGTLTINGNSATNRILIYTFGIGIQITITAANVSMSNVDFRDVIAAGTANWNLSAISGGSGDVGGNSGITFTPSATQYWKTTTTGSKTWSTVGNWFLATNGGGGAGRVPLPQDDARFDSNSIGATSTTITQDMPRAGRSIDWTGVTNTPTWTTSTTASIFGSLTMASGMTLTGSNKITFEGRASFNLMMAGKTFEKDIMLNAPGGTLTLQDPITLGITRELSIEQGTFNANNKDVSVGKFHISGNSSAVCAVVMGSGNWTLTGTSTVWNSGSSVLTLTPGTSTIVINNTSSSSKTFQSDGKVFNNLQFTGAGTGALTINGSNTFNNLTISTAPKTVNFGAGTTQTITGTFTANGSSGNLITFRSSSTPTKWTLNAAATSLSYIDVKDSTGGGAASPFACGATCVNSGNNTGWTF